MCTSIQRTLTSFLDSNHLWCTVSHSKLKSNFAPELHMDDPSNLALFLYGSLSAKHISIHVQQIYSNLLACCKSLQKDHVLNAHARFRTAAEQQGLLLLEENQFQTSEHVSAIPAMQIALA